MQKNSSLQLELTVYEYFLRSMKKNNLYSQIVQGYKDLISPRCGDKTFRKCNTLPKFLSHLKAFCDTHDENPRPSNERNKNYDRVVNTTNQLLRFFVESRNVLHGNAIPKLGQEIFNQSCAKLFGKKFIDDMKKFNAHPQNVPNALIEREIDALKKMGKLPAFDVPIEVFMKYRNSILSKLNAVEYENLIRYLSEFDSNQSEFDIDTYDDMLEECEFEEEDNNDDYGY